MSCCGIVHSEAKFQDLGGDPQQAMVRRPHAMLLAHMAYAPTTTMGYVFPVSSLDGLVQKRFRLYAANADAQPLQEVRGNAQTKFLVEGREYRGVVEKCLLPMRREAVGAEN